MTKEIRTEILIHSTPERVWNILTDFGHYPDWNPFIRSVHGYAEKSRQLKVRIQPANGKMMTFKPVILSRTEHKELRWRGVLLFPGLFDGEHSFELIDNGNGTVTFIQSERFKGILVGLFNMENTQKGFHDMNKKLKELAERGTGQG